MESLALKYRHVVEQLIAAGGRPIEVIHIVGGGAQNALLCQMTANATGRPVLAGPVEATALGNGLAQLIAMGELKDMAEARTLIRTCLLPTRYEPSRSGQWDAVYQRFRTLMTAPVIRIYGFDFTSAPHPTKSHHARSLLGWKMIICILRNSIACQTGPASKQH